MSSISSLLEKSFSDISSKWDDDIIPTLEDFIRIPNQSPMFDANWKQHGHMDHALQLMIAWCKKQNINGMTVQAIEDEGYTPLLYLEIPGAIDETILMYGHMDKQPAMTGWDANKGPWNPVIEDGKLYGRGGADDGYALFASIAAIQLLQHHHIPHARIVIIIEASEESGSNDLPHYLQQLQHKIGQPNFVMCLDSGCGNYEQLWSTTSLRGLIEGTLHINVLKDGIHSGMGSGVVPSAFNVLRQLLNRIEDPVTHAILLDALNTKIPAERTRQAQHTAQSLGHTILSHYTFAEHTQPITADLTELLLNRTWRAALSIVGQDGLPPTEKGGNVTIPSLSTKLSVRIPPNIDADTAVTALKHALEVNPPYGASICFTPGHCASGWDAPPLAAWLERANHNASMLFYKKPCAYIGEGGSIPFMGMLGALYPKAQFLISGVLGPKSNAHGPNEFLHIEMAKRLTGCIASVIAEHAQQRN